MPPFWRHIFLTYETFCLSHPFYLQSKQQRRTIYEQKEAAVDDLDHFDPADVFRPCRWSDTFVRGHQQQRGRAIPIPDRKDPCRIKE